MKTTARWASLALLGGVTLSQITAASAMADDVDVNISFANPTALSIEYGEYWYFTATADSWAGYLNDPPGFGTAELTFSGPGSYTPSMQFGTYGSSLAQFSIGPSQTQPALTPGSYSLKITSEGQAGEISYHGTTATAATLTITKAPLGIEFRVVPDSTNPDDVIVTARFTGTFVDGYQPSFYPGAAQSPEGTWHITITDQDGAVATERSVERSAGDDVLATSFYWADAEPGVQYTASAEFIASGQSAGNFTVEPAPDFSFTGAERARPVPTSTATGRPDQTLPESSAFGLPPWVLVLAGVLGLGLGALVTVLSVRVSRLGNAVEKAVEA